MGEHWIVENKRWGNSGLRVVTDPAAAAQYRTWRGWEVTGPFIEKPSDSKPITDLIERCEGWIKSLDFYATTHDGSPEMVVAVAVEMRAEAEQLARTVQTRDQDVCADCGHRWNAHRGDGVCLHCGCEAKLVHYAGEQQE